MPSRPLTERQRQVLSLLAEGLTYDVIAERLTVSYGTVSTYASQIIERLKARNSSHAVAIGLREGLIT